MSRSSLKVPQNFDRIYFKHKTYNPRVTYHCLLIPKGDAIQILRDPYNMELLNYIETRALCLIRISSYSQLDSKLDFNTCLGWWKLEIFYHQTRGNHKKCMSMLHELLKKLSRCGKTSVHLLPIKTLECMFPVNHKIKAFLENGCVRHNPMYGGPTLETLLEDVKPVKYQSSTIPLYSNFEDNAEKKNFSLFFENFNSRKAPMWISSDWNMTNEKLDYLSKLMTQNILNPDNYSTLNNEMKKLNIKSIVIKLAKRVLKEELLQKK